MGAVLSVFWNSGERRLRAAWRLLAFAAACCLIWFPCLVAVGFFMAWDGAISGSFPLLLTALSYGAAVAAAVGAMVLSSNFIDRRTFADFGFALSGRWWAELVAGIALGAALVALLTTFLTAAGWAEIEWSARTSGAGFSLWHEIGAWTVLYIGIGLVEEILCRSVLMKNLAEGFRFISIRGAAWAALAISALLFSMLHLVNPSFSLAAFTNILLAGVCLGVVYAVTKSLALPIGFHISWNWAQAPLFGLPVSGFAEDGASFVSTRLTGPEWLTGGPFGIEAGLPATVVLLASTAAFLAWGKMRWGRLLPFEWLTTPELRGRPPSPVAKPASDAE